MNQMIPKLKQYIMHGFEYSEQFSREPLPQPIKQMESVRKYEEYMTTQQQRRMKGELEQPPYGGPPAPA